MTIQKKDASYLIDNDGDWEQGYNTTNGLTDGKGEIVINAKAWIKSQTYNFLKQILDQCKGPKLEHHENRLLFTMTIKE